MRIWPSKGVFVRPRWDWTLERGGAGGANQAAVAGQFAFVLLFNDLSPARALGIYMLYAAGAATGNVLRPFFVAGSLGSLAVVGASVVSNGASPGGSIYSGSALALPGTPLGSFVSGNNGQVWLSTSPLFILSPGYSIGVANTTLNAQITSSFWWAPL